jgi:hypothetical protein
MEVFEALKYLMNDVLRILLDSLAREKKLCQIASFDMVHHNHELSICLKKSSHFDNKWVVNVLDNIILHDLVKVVLKIDPAFIRYLNCDFLLRTFAEKDLD